MKRLVDQVVKCRNCAFWDKLGGGSKSKNTDIGNCLKITEKKIRICHEDKSIINVPKEKMIVFTASELVANIGDIQLSSVSPNVIHRFNWCQTSGNFFCGFFEEKPTK